MLRGLLLFSVLFLATIPVFLLFLLLGLPILLLPSPARIALRGPQVACGRLWILLSTRIVRLFGIPSPRIEGGASLDPQGQYLLLCNHTSWTDIMVLLQLFGARMPFPRFLAKREMLWIPLIGIAIWMLDFPLLRRSTAGDSPERSARDRAAVARGCRRLGSGAFTLVIFPEGTRFTPEKHAAQQSSYRHLLRPRAGGLGVALEHLGGRLDGVVDVTIGYANKGLNYLDYLGGRGGVVRARVDVLSPPGDLAAHDEAGRREVLQEWLNALWRRKDAQLETWQSAEGVSGSRAGVSRQGPV